MGRPSSNAQEWNAGTLLADGKEITGRLMFQTSVFPVAPGGSSTVQIRYSQLLKKESGLIDFLLPLATVKHSSGPVENVSVTVNLIAAAPIRTVYSPTHQVDISRPDATHAVSQLRLHQVAVPDDFRLLYSTDAGAVGLNVVSFRPDANEDGYFVLLATPDTSPAKAPKLAKTTVFVCDRSGSMSGPKIAQVKAALQFLLRQLEPADTFNIVAFDSEVETFRPELQRADSNTIRAALDWVDGLSAGGGTNIGGALRIGLGMLHDRARPNYLLFLTDGAPTAGVTDETRIAANAALENQANARMFVFGVGFDVNGRLLDRLARELRGQSVYVRPNENIEAPVSALYAKIGTPVLTDVAVDIQLDGGTTSRVYPRQMPDLFRGDQLVLVGRYRPGGAARIHLTGSGASGRQDFWYRANFAAGSSDDTNAYVARLWVMRRIGEIIDGLDLHGRNQELVDELVSLSQKYGILTPYTSFLADERVNLSAVRDNGAAAFRSVGDQLSVTGGAAGFAQREMKAQFQNTVTVSAAAPVVNTLPAQQMVQQVGQNAFFKKGRVWQDSGVTADQAKNAIHVTQFSREYFDLAASQGGTLSQYLDLDGPILVNLGQQTYQIDPEVSK